MHSRQAERRSVLRQAVVLLTTMTVSGAMAATATAASATPARPPKLVKAWVKHTSSTDEFGIAHPTGVAYSARDHALLVTGARSGGGTSLLATDTAARRIASSSIPDALTGAMSLDPATGRVVGLASSSLVTLDASKAASGIASPARRAMGRDLGHSTVNLAFAPDGRMFALDAGARKVDVFTVPPTGAPSLAGSIPLSALPTGRVAGLAYNATDGLLYVDIPSRAQLHGVDQSGNVAVTYDMSSVDVTSLQAMTFAPTADNTDAAANTSLYMADGGSSTQNGGIAEVYLTAQVMASATSTATLVKDTETSTYSPASPDPCGITYLPETGKLLMSDSEVDEMAWLFANTNLFGLNLDGTQVPNATSVTLPWSHEPTGISYDVRTGHLWVSDDDQQKVFDLVPGADGRFGTADDSWSSFSVSKGGSMDPEDLTIDTDNGNLYIVDGVSAEVYSWSPGPNQKFDGVPAAGGDDVVSQFDVAAYGATDPEGIDYSPERGTLFLVDHGSHAVYELTTTGQLVNVVDISAAKGYMEASIVLAPSSIGAGESFYITDRRKDNNDVPDMQENDGALYELLPNLPSGGNTAPRVNAGSDQSLALGQSATLSATVSDDGLPNGQVATTWSTVSGPLGAATFADPGATTTAVTFAAAGAYVLRLTASDGQLSSIDDVAIQVFGPDHNFVTNPGFETGTTGWSTNSSTSGAGVTINQVAPGHTGSFAAAVANPSASAVRCSMTDRPDSVSTTATVPVPYTGSMWVRGDTAGTQLELALREYAIPGGALAGSRTATIALTTGWQQVAVSYTPVSPGASSLDLTASVYGAPTGTCFVADDASVTVNAPTTTATVTPESLTFDPQAVGTSSPAQPVTVTNTGSNPLTIGAVTLSGAGAAGFSVVPGYPMSVPTGASSSMSFVFTPTQEGPASATATIASTAGGVLSVQLAGTGVLPHLSSSPTALDFGTRTGPSAPQTVTVTNDGLVPATVTAVSIAGSNAADFSSTGSCGNQVLAAAGTCTVSVTFTPRGVGVRQAHLDLLTTGNAVLLSVPLSGTGRSLLTAAPATVDFGGTLVNATSPSKTVTITNAGSAPVSGITTTMSGPQAAQFARTTTCGTLAPSATCTVAVTFKPTVGGAASATLSVSTPDVPNAASVALSGSGQLSADLSLVSVSGPTKPAPASTVTYTVTAKNGGPSATTATIVTTLPTGLSYVQSSPAGCELSGATLTCVTSPLAKGQSASVAITIKVTAAANAKLTINAAVSATSTVDPSPGNATGKLSITVAKK